MHHSPPHVSIHLWRPEELIGHRSELAVAITLDTPLDESVHIQSRFQPGRLQPLVGNGQCSEAEGVNVHFTAQESGDAAQDIICEVVSSFERVR